MIYTIDVGFLDTDYRLKQDGSFKQFNGESSKDVESDDKTFESYSDANFVADKIDSITVDNEIINVRTSQLGSEHVTVRPHRTDKPQNAIFTRDDLRNVLLNGNDNRNNSLILDFDGNLRLIPFEDWPTTPHAVRYESFVAGNGYVGSENSLSHLESTYLSMLSGWERHLQSHDTVYIDYTVPFDEQSKIAAIKELVNQL